MTILRGARRALPRALFPASGAALFLIGAGTFAADAQVVSLDLLNRLTTLEDSAKGTKSTLGLLDTKTAANGNLLSVHDGLLTGLKTDVGELRTGLTAVDTALDGVNAKLATNTTDLADLRVTVGDLSDLLGNLDVPDVIDVTGPVDVSSIVGSLNRQAVSVAANATGLANANVNIGVLQNNDAKQDLRLDDHDRRITQVTNVVAGQQLVLNDHERRITQNTSDIQRHEAAIGDLQSQMASGFAGIDDELRHQSRRIDKATEGVAMAMAMKSPAVPEDKNFAIFGSFGAFDGQTALAFAGGVRATEALQFDAGVAVGLDRGSVGGRAGATLAW
ncbi:YadA C-terminal domain-containing protein [Aureimonas leprariae]|uniref:Trimeric autotransporter adhesin YadA-like C-terminal membrane anchor domain-containing protein n=1 Tax=Plantimonas leprariae TaxID=2615207 RepID=A0A7V7PPH5_9HYPH|nr:YadA C-terminal domain-containing protein [Aureimonas leprariae]KAB0679923.1 hypothetical protein F6X38_10125 [Aureimonas leprariae]